MSVCVGAPLKKCGEKVSRKGRTGADIGCLDRSTLRGFISGHPGCCWYVLGHMFLQTLSVFGSSVVQQNLDSCVFLFLVIVLCSFTCVFGSDGSQLVWAGLVICGSDVSGFD